jgi:hypothetical protein
LKTRKNKILMLFALVKLTWRMMDLMCKLKILWSPTRSLLHQLPMDKLFKKKDAVEESKPVATNGDADDDDLDSNDYGEESKPADF